MTTTDQIAPAVKNGQLLSTAADNLRAWLQAGLPAWAEQSLLELISRGEWGELNDRFYRYLEFGTGGMRGRTIGVRSVEPGLTSNAMSVPAVLVVELSTAYTKRCPSGVNWLTATRRVVTTGVGSRNERGSSGGRGLTAQGSATSSTCTPGAWLSAT